MDFTALVSRLREIEGRIRRLERMEPPTVGSTPEVPVDETLEIDYNGDGTLDQFRLYRSAILVRTTDFTWVGGYCTAVHAVGFGLDVTDSLTYDALGEVDEIVRAVV